VDTLLHLDRELFLLLHYGLQMNWLTPVMVFFSEANKYLMVRLIVLGVWLYMLYRGGKARTFALLLLPAIILSNEACDLLKNWTGRERPCVAMPDIKVLTGVRLTSGSFPSAHAANIAALFALAASVWGKRLWLYLSWLPFLTGLSRVYVGVHYPLDILGGWLLGGLIGFGLFWLVMKWQRRKSRVSEFGVRNSGS
jgi:undecaprenyl-diphosphatase